MSRDVISREWVGRRGGKSSRATFRACGHARCVCTRTRGRQSRKRDGKGLCKGRSCSPPCRGSSDHIYSVIDAHMRLRRKNKRKKCAQRARVPATPRHAMSPRFISRNKTTIKPQCISVIIPPFRITRPCRPPRT